VYSNNGVLETVMVDEQAEELRRTFYIEPMTDQTVYCEEIDPSNLNRGGYDFRSVNIHMYHCTTTPPLARRTYSLGLASSRRFSQERGCLKEKKVAITVDYRRA
jgi:hypothetical protein